MYSRPLALCSACRPRPPLPGNLRFVLLLHPHSRLTPHRDSISRKEKSVKVSALSHFWGRSAPLRGGGCLAPRAGSLSTALLSLLNLARTENKPNKAPSSERPFLNPSPRCRDSRRNARGLRPSRVSCGYMQTKDARAPTKTTSISRNLSRSVTNFVDIKEPTGDPFDGGASIFSSTVNLANTVLGPGMLALPRSIALAGLVPGVLLVIANAALHVMTNIYLSDACETVVEKGLPRDATIRKISDAASGSFYLIFDTAIVLFAFGVCTSYVMARAMRTALALAASLLQHA